MKLKLTLKILGKMTAVLVGLFATGAAFALDLGTTGGTTTTVTLQTIKSNLGSSVTSLAAILQIVCLISGVGFVMASFFKFHQHKLNPTQVPMSQGVSLLLIGAGLLLFPLLLPTATKAAFGTTKIATTSGKAITDLITKH